MAGLSTGQAIYQDVYTRSTKAVLHGTYLLMYYTGMGDGELNQEFSILECLSVHPVECDCCVY